jgi:tRNA wybutosine-synthesizing protein 3
MIDKDFETKKRRCLDKLYKPDKSRKGDVDELIVPLIETINSFDEYYTTSSCSGRIYLLTEADAKPDVKWIYVSHNIIKSSVIIEILSENNLKAFPDKRIWLRQEGLILHVACKSLDAANKILNVARDSGLRRSGIIADSKSIIVEICSTEKLDVPVAYMGKALVNEEYLVMLTDIANQKMLKGRKKSEELLVKIENFRVNTTQEDNDK